MQKFDLSDDIRLEISDDDVVKVVKTVGSAEIVILKLSLHLGIESSDCYIDVDDWWGWGNG